MRILVRFILLLLASQCVGCFTQTYLSKDEPTPEDRYVVFHLGDSTRIASPSGKHRRIEEGYEVIGKLSTERGDVDKFEGIILNEEIIGITIDQYNPVGTGALVAGAGIVLFLILTHWGRAI